MKQTFKFFAMAAMALIASVSCIKEDNVKTPDSQNELHFVVTSAENVPVKSFIDNNLDGTYTPNWSKGDELALFVGTINEKVTAPTGVLANINETGTIAKFDGNLTGVPEEGSFLSFAPRSAFNGCYNSGEVGIYLKGLQQPTYETIDEACDVLVAKPCDYMAEDGTVAISDLLFKRIFSVLKVNLKGVDALNGEKVTSFKLTAPDIVLTGRASVNLSDATISSWTVKEFSVLAKYTEETAPVFGDEPLNTVYFVVNPTTIPAASELLFEAETANYTISKTVTLPKDIVLPESQIAVINLTIGEDNYASKSSVTYAKLTSQEVKNAGISTSYKNFSLKQDNGAQWEGYIAYNNSGIQIRRNDDKKKNDSYLKLPDFSKEITRVNLVLSQKMDADKTITFENAADATTGTVASVTTTTTATEYSFDLKGKGYTTAYLRVKDAAMYVASVEVLTDENIPVPPTVNVEKTLNLSAEESNGTIPVIFTNMESADVKVYSDEACTTEGASWLTAKINTDNTAIEYTATANEGESRTAYIKVKATNTDGEATAVITVTQSKAVSGDEAYYVKVTSEPTDWTGKYLIVFDNNAHATASGKDLQATVNNLTIIDGKILSNATVDAAAMIVEKSGESYTMKYPDGNFFKANTSSVSSLTSENVKFTYTNSGVEISSLDGNTILYKNKSNSTTPYYRCYSRRTDANFSLPQLYKLEGEGGSETPSEPVAVNGVSLDKTTLDLKVGGTATLTATVNPSNATDKTVSWSSSAETIATVDQTGKVTAVAEGNATITVTTTDGSYTATCDVTVTAASQGGEEKNFEKTYSNGDLTGWSLTNYELGSGFYKVPSGDDPSVATLLGIFTGKTVTSDVVVTLNVATFGGGTNPTASTFSIFADSACATSVVSTQSGTLPNSSSYTNVTYTVTAATAADIFTDDLAIKITKPGKQIRLKSISVKFSYTE